MTVIKPIPTGSAAARQTPEISSCRRGDEPLFGSELVGWLDNQEQERECRCSGYDVDKGPRPRRQHGDDGGHAHVLVTVERCDGAEHGQPQEQGRGEFIRPDDRLMKNITTDDTGEQDDDLSDDE
ncbi:hypothetical protein ACVWY2_000549 [Bradyrhizobium sp. JR6.1]